MQTYKLKTDTEWDIMRYKKAIENHREIDAFLGINPEYRIGHRDSYYQDITDTHILIEYSLYPIYVEGDFDIPDRIFDILKELASSQDIIHLYQVVSFIKKQEDLLEEYDSLPFIIDAEAIVPIVLDSIYNLPNEKKVNYYRNICNLIDSMELFKNCDKEKVEYIVNEQKKEENKNRRKIKSVAEVWPIVLDVTSIDAMGVSDDHLELLLIDENKWIESLEEEHLLKLQEKLNNYIYFLENKQYVERYGDSFDKKVIHITFQYSPSDNGLAFLATVQKTLQNTDMSLKVELPDDDTVPEKKNLSVNVSHPNHNQEKVSQERYLQIKKEYKVRLVLVVFLLVLSFILYLFIVLSFSRHIPFIATVMGTVIPFNHFLLVPVWQEKKAIEEEHPEWKNLSTSGVKVPSSESDKKILPFIGTVLALFFSFAMLYRPVKVNTKIPTAEEIKNMPRFDNNYTPKSKSSSSSEPVSKSDLNETSSTN